MKFLRSAARRLETGGELLRFFAKNKTWWLTPMILLLLIFGVLVVFAQTSAIAPFIYTLF